MTVGIIDIGICNLRSVEKAVYALGHDPLFVKAPAQLADVERVILPGVGSFRVASEALAKADLTSALRSFASEKPLLGICLGMQLLASWGEEGGGAEGLDLVPGRVVLLAPPPPAAGERPLRVPHVGWNTVDVVRAHPVFAGTKKGRDFYFVHSFHLVPTVDEQLVGRTAHGVSFASAVANGKALGVQFHPEKSQAVGLSLLERFLDWDGETS